MVGVVLMQEHAVATTLDARAFSARSSLHVVVGLAFVVGLRVGALWRFACTAAGIVTVLIFVFVLVTVDVVFFVVVLLYISNFTTESKKDART